MLHLLATVFFLYASSALAQNPDVFRVGTVSYNYEGAVPSSGTFAVFYGDSALSAVTMPDGKPLFDLSSPLSNVNFWGSSPKVPVPGTYQALLEDKTILRTSLDPNALLPSVKNLSVSYGDETLAVTWTTLEEAQTYEVTLSQEGETGDDLTRCKVQRGSATFAVALEPGSYIVIVRAFNYPTDSFPLPSTNLAVSETSRLLIVQ